MRLRQTLGRVRIGVRWWLSLAFALVAAAAAAAAVLAFAHAKSDFRSHAEQLVAGKSFVAAQELMASLAAGTPAQTALHEVARREQLDLALFASSPRPVAATAPLQEAGRQALERALSGKRSVASSDNGRHVVVGIPLGGVYRALVARSSGSSLPAELQIVQDATVRVGAIAAAIGFIVGLVLAQLIALRLRRISTAAHAISAGDFSTPVPSGVLRDEFAELAEALERVRQELKGSFGRLASERDALRELLERLREGVVAVDGNLAVQLTNAEARRLVGPTLVEGRTLPDGAGLDLRLRAERLFGSDEPQGERLALADGRTIAVVGVPARGQGDSAMLVLADVTDELRREEAEREFVANAAHELRTPLTTIIGAVEVLEAGAKEDPVERDRFIAHIGRESARLARLAHALLLLARAQTGAAPPPSASVDVCELLHGVRGRLEPKPGVAVEVECDDELLVWTNAELLEQAVRNLAENAVKHTARGRVLLRASGEDDALRIDVADTGSGIAASARPRIFDRFYRGAGRTGEGYGLGLAMVLQAVQVLGGSIEVESERGVGSTFTLVLAGVREREEALV